MRLRRRPGAFVAFVDSFTEETILRIECDADDVDQISFRLYDKTGGMVADSEGPQRFPEGVEITAADGEVLLYVPPVRDESIKYTLYNLEGKLLTSSDGQRTQIYGGVRVEGNKHLSGRPPSPKGAQIL